MMTNKEGAVIEMVAAMLGIFALTDCERFAWKHVIVGSILALYVFQGFKRRKTIYDAILYSCVASLVILIAIGKPLDWLRDRHLRETISREGILGLSWSILLIILAIIQHLKSQKERGDI